MTGNSELRERVQNGTKIEPDQNSKIMSYINGLCVWVDFIMGLSLTGKYVRYD